MSHVLTGNRKSDHKEGIEDAHCHARLSGIFKEITEDYSKR